MLENAAGERKDGVRYQIKQRKSLAVKDYLPIKAHSHPPLCDYAENSGFDHEKSSLENAKYLKFQTSFVCKFEKKTII
jgi:hypothetical protein